MEISPMTLAAILAEKIGDPTTEKSKLLPELNLEWSYLPETPAERKGWKTAMNFTLSELMRFTTDYSIPITPFHLYDLFNLWIFHAECFKRENQLEVLPAYFATLKDIMKILNRIFEDGPEYINLEWMNEKFSEEMEKYHLR